jgi:hypothetical protein
MNQTKTETLAMARRLYREVLTDAEFDQAVDEVLALGDSYVHEFSVRILAAIIQERVRDKGPLLTDPL